MNYPVPAYLTPFISIGMLAVVIAVLSVLKRALRRTTLPGAERGKAFSSLSVLLLAWFATATITSLVGFYRPPSGNPPTIQYGLLAPIALGVLLFKRWPLLRRAVAAIPDSWLIAVQLYRALGVIFLILYAGGHLPGLFALPAGVGDVLVGVIAPLVALAYARSPQGSALWAWLWNLFGITDLVVAVTLGFLTSPSPLQLAAFDHPSVLIGMFPLVLIPVFAVPLSILLHLASLQKLRTHQTALRTNGTPNAGSSHHVMA